MSQKNETPLLIAALLFTAAIVGAGYWWFTRNNSNPVSNVVSSSTPSLSPGSSQGNDIQLTTSVPAGTTVKIDGSTSMVGINQALKRGFETKFPNTIIFSTARGSSKGLELLKAGTIDLAAISRPLTPEEQKDGLVTIPVTKDYIAVIIGEKNPFKGSLSQSQIMGIFTGLIKKWSQVGGPDAPIMVYNRPIESGTRTAFQDIALGGGNFGKASNIITMPVDGTTNIIQKLGTNGISYATAGQAAEQKTARIVPIDGLKPGDSNYPFVRFLYYVYKTPANEPAKAFLGYATSPEGKMIIDRAVK